MGLFRPNGGCPGHTPSSFHHRRRETLPNGPWIPYAVPPFSPPTPLRIVIRPGSATKIRPISSPVIPPYDLAAWRSRPYRKSVAPFLVLLFFFSARKKNKKKTKKNPPCPLPPAAFSNTSPPTTGRRQDWRKQTSFLSAGFPRPTQVVRLESNQGNLSFPAPGETPQDHREGLFGISAGAPETETLPSPASKGPICPPASLGLSQSSMRFGPWDPNCKRPHNQLVPVRPGLPWI